MTAVQAQAGAIERNGPDTTSLDRSTPLLRTAALTHRYGDYTALQDLNLAVHAGEIFGYVGPNGAGKTTTFRILCGLLSPTSGQAFVVDQEVTHNKDRIKQLVGYLPDSFGVYPTLRVWEYLDFFAAAYKLPRRLRRQRIDECLKTTSADEYRDSFMGALSRGMKQCVGIAKTLLHDPQVVILDEPAATIDPRARIQIRALLRRLADLGKAVLVSSHILPELADVCDSVGILRAGKLIACGPVQEILRRVRQDRVIQVETLDGARRAQELLKRAPGSWELLPAEQTNSTLRYRVRADETQLSQALETLVQGGVAVVSFAEVPVNLEDAFMILTE